MCHLIGGVTGMDIADQTTATTAEGGLITITSERNHHPNSREVSHPSEDIFMTSLENRTLSNISKQQNRPSCT